MKTRNVRKSQKMGPVEDDATEQHRRTLAPSSNNPPLLFTLPEKRSCEARIITLRNPATTRLERYFNDPSLGIYEFTKIAAPKRDPSSWLLAPISASSSTIESSESSLLRHGYVMEDQAIFVATEMDPVFFLCQSLLADSSGSDRNLFLTLDDHVDRVDVLCPGLREVLTSRVVMDRLESSMPLICDKIEAGDETMFRLSMQKLACYLLRKSENVVRVGLPPSLEENFVSQALQAPSMRSQLDMVAELEREESGEQGEPSETNSMATPSAQDSQSSTATSGSVLTAATSLPEESVTDTAVDVKNLLRLRTAVNFILGSYVLPKYHGKLQEAIRKAPEAPDFGALDKRLDEIAQMKKEAQTLQSLSQNIGRKRMVDEDEEVVAAREEKRRKKEEEEAKKKAQSRSIKQLSKVNTSGMKKMSSFFTKAPPKKAAG